jgi:hypothetical protein
MFHPRTRVITHLKINALWPSKVLRYSSLVSDWCSRLRAYVFSGPILSLARADHLGEVKKVIEATADLRATSGKLSANNVASVFGLSVAELAALVGRTRQTASKTPDADSLQPLLQPFERVARVRAVLSQKEFRKWLHLANDELFVLLRDRARGAL